MEGLKNCVSSWCNKNAIKSSFLSQYIENVDSLVDKRISDLKKNMKSLSFTTSFHQEIKNELEILQQKYVMVPIDKASGNVAFVCKRFYLKVLLDELGYGKSNLNATYEQITTSVEDIKSKHVNFLSDKFKLKQLSSESKLPNIYWLPKMHKTPIKFRFIITAPDCTIKPLAKSLTSIFSLFYKQIESYNKKCSFFSGVNTFWVIQNNQPVIKAIKKINDRRQGRSIETFIFLPCIPKYHITS